MLKPAEYWHGLEISTKYRDTDRLHLSRKEGLWGLRSMQATFRFHITSCGQHFVNNGSQIKYINLVLKGEENNILCVGSKLFKKHSLPGGLPFNSQHTSKKTVFVKVSTYQKKKKKRKKRPCICIFSQRLEQDRNTGMKRNLSWIHGCYIMSRFESCAFAI